MMCIGNRTEHAHTSVYGQTEQQNIWRTAGEPQLSYILAIFAPVEQQHTPSATPTRSHLCLLRRRTCHPNTAIRSQ